ncbi:hypothetical protein FB45DRAFT_1017679 [Roridomyces roridus]|uniref:Uncharacterized protein n=1 Tax=Roridomyces roridus TaxID=1738132 RepID=A0AAD7CJL3_9AGAR|nr:hypothetical protein FB45DRAFT_1017679 [Roridomyces roridus]
MGFFADDSTAGQAYVQVRALPLISKSSSSSLTSSSAAVSFYASRELERHEAEVGKPASPADTQVLIASFVGPSIDKEVEMRGLEFVNKDVAKYDAVKAAFAEYYKEA